MAKKYIVRKFNPGQSDHNKVNPLINLSALSLNAAQSVLKTSLALGASETTQSPFDQYTYNDAENNPFALYKDITNSQSQSYAYYDLSYPARRDYLQLLSQQNTLGFVLDTVSDEMIILDENNYFAHLDIDLLKLRLNANYRNSRGETADDLIKVCQRSFKDIYQLYGWDKSNDAWNYCKKFLIEGYLAFEFIFDDLYNPTTMIGIKNLDPATLEPAIETLPSGKEVKVWYQYKGDASMERKIPDSNIVYISWSSGMLGESQRISYLEGLTRSYNMLQQIENSRMIWNIQNAQKRLKILVPVGNVSNDKARAKINELKADWNEETTIDDVSGEMVVNGQPRFSFTKTYFFPKRDNGEITIEEMATEGYDLSSIEPLKYFWRRFILETKVPANRFMIDPASEASHSLTDDSTVTREEYAFSRFINRIRVIYREILLKPLWILICIRMPELSNSELLKQYIGIVFNEENTFALAKERAAIQKGCEVIQSLAGLQISEGNPFFSMKFLIQKYLGLSDEDLAINEKFKQGEQLDRLEQAKTLKRHKEQGPQVGEQPADGPGSMGGDFGGGGSADFGGGDFGGGDTGGSDFGGGDSGSDTGGDF